MISLSVISLNLSKTSFQLYSVHSGTTTNLSHDSVVCPILFIIIQKKAVTSEITIKELVLKDIHRNLN